MDHRAKVLPLMTAWGYRGEMIGDIRAVLDVYRVETVNGVKNLKWTRHAEAKLEFILSALNYLTANGFNLLRPPIPTVSGPPFLVAEGEHYLLSDWIEGEKADFTSPSQLAGSCRTLALFHQASCGYRPPKDNHIRSRWGSMLNSLRMRCAELEALSLRHLKPATGQTAFDRLVGEESQYYLRLSQTALALLDRSKYEELNLEMAVKGGLCHGDVAARNFIITPAGDVCLIDFDSMLQDLPLIDLWKLYRRVMKTFKWDFALGLGMLEAYESINPLSASELEVLLALLSFPQKFWRLANRYYGGRYRVDEARFHRKLVKYTGQSQAHALFLSRFARLCQTRGAITPQTAASLPEPPAAPDPGK